MPVGKMLESIFNKKKPASSEEDNLAVKKKLNTTDVTNKGSSSVLGVSTMTDNSDRLRENLKEAKNIMRWK
jgi:hypothetical protein